MYVNRVILVGTVLGEVKYREDRCATFLLRCGEVGHLVLVEDESLVMANQRLLREGAVVSLQGELHYTEEGACVAVRSRRGSDLMVLAAHDGAPVQSYRNLDDGVPMAAEASPLATAAVPRPADAAPAPAAARGAPIEAAPVPGRPDARPPSVFGQKRREEESDAPPPERGESSATHSSVSPQAATSPAASPPSGLPSRAGMRAGVSRPGAPRPGVAPAGAPQQARPPVQSAPPQRKELSNDDIPF